MMHIEPTENLGPYKEFAEDKPTYYVEEYNDEPRKARLNPKAPDRTRIPPISDDLGGGVFSSKEITGTQRANLYSMPDPTPEINIQQ